MLVKTLYLYEGWGTWICVQWKRNDCCFGIAEFEQITTIPISHLHGR